MIAEVMGAPAEDAPRLWEWANRIQQQFDPVKVQNELPEIERAAGEFVEYTRALMREREAEPREDLITQLLPAGEEGVHLVSAILVGGVDTTQSQLAHGIRLFAEHPRPVAAAGRRPGDRARGRRGGPAPRADHAVHRADRARGDRVPRRASSRRAR